MNIQRIKLLLIQVLVLLPFRLVPGLLLHEPTKHETYLQHQTTMSGQLYSFNFQFIYTFSKSFFSSHTLSFFFLSHTLQYDLFFSNHTLLFFLFSFYLYLFHTILYESIFLSLKIIPPHALYVVLMLYTLPSHILTILLTHLLPLACMSRILLRFINLLSTKNNGTIF